jgi:hypothetical protein
MISTSRRDALRLRNELRWPRSAAHAAAGVNRSRVSRDQRFFRSDRRKTKCGFLVRLTLIPASAGKFPELGYLKEQAAPVTVGPRAEIFLPPSWRCSRS